MQAFKLTIFFSDGDTVIDEVRVASFQELTHMLCSAFETTHWFMLHNSTLYSTRHIKYINIKKN